MHAIYHVNTVKPVMDCDLGFSCPVDHKWRSCVYSQWTPGYTLLRLWPPVIGHIRDIYQPGGVGCQKPAVPSGMSVSISLI